MRLLCLCLFLTACASRTPVSDRLVRQKSVEQSAVAGVPFYPQEEFQCGPSALAMLLTHRGLAVTPFDLKTETISKEDAGSFRTDLISATRRRGLLALEVSTFEQVLQQLKAGHPVLVLQNLGFALAPVWHFAVAFKYDLARESITLHSGKVEHLEMHLRQFEKSWNWGLVTLNPGEVAPLEEITHARAAAGLEEIGFLEEAEKTYLAMLKQWPNSLPAFLGLANIAHARSENLKAVAFLERAKIGYPKESMVWHNLAFAYGSLGQKQRAKRSSLEALKLVPPSEHEAYFASLSPWLGQSANNNLRPEFPAKSQP